MQITTRLLFDLLSGKAPLAPQTLEERAWVRGRGFAFDWAGLVLPAGAGSSPTLSYTPPSPKGGARFILDQLPLLMTRRLRGIP